MNQLQLIPVLEIPWPSHIFTGMDESPLGPYTTHASEWDEYRKSMFVKAGFQSYIPIMSGISFYTLEQFTNISDLRVMIEAHLRPGDDAHPLSITEICPFFGGVVLFIDGQPKLYPQCCGTMDDFLSWKSLIKPDFDNGWVNLGGHPSPKVQLVGELLQFTCKDEDETFVPRTDDVIIVNQKALSHAVSIAEAEFLKFGKRLNQLANEYDEQDIAQYLLWRNE